MKIWQQYVICIVPALCDLTATAAMNIGLLWISASVWQMLRGSMTIFTALFSKFFLHKALYAYHWVGVGIVCFALCVVAFSSLMIPYQSYTIGSAAGGSGSSNEGVSIVLQAVGIILVVVAQVIQATQIVLEQHIMEGVNLAPTLIVGLEGLWGGLVCSVVLVIVYYIPAPIGEDTIDTFIMMSHSAVLTGLIVAYATAILCYNMFGMYVTQVFNAVVRTILEALRTACIWVTDLFIYYVISQDFGEYWTNWSYLQLCGFLFLLCGLFVYNRLLMIEGLEYPTPAQIKEKEKEIKARLAARKKKKHTIEEPEVPTPQGSSS
eukprot:TRINITY_DN107_c0_g1_i3.p1 TRINITY_DN107_c0_g1~~TRINITY_DN107_c0_g1_i3.p1  ORF type:complete len:364 (-),score=113.52 TRINITY_DN107_c0_g1_i3:126-1088(-)